MHSDASAPVALVGLSGAGKSAVAPLLGARLGRASEDLDARIEAEAGARVTALFERGGEPEFRRLEAEALARAIERGAGVIACGGGIVTSAGARELLRARCRTLWLEVSPAVAALRLAATSGDRPLLRGADSERRLAALLEERAPRYAEVSIARIATDGLAPDAVAEAAQRALEALEGREAEA